MKYIPRRFEGRHFLSGSVTQGKASKKLFVTSASDPAATDDTGLGYAVGATWVNTTSGQVFICTVETAEDATWVGQEGDTINEPFKIQGSTSGFNYCWSDPGAYPNVINKFSFTSDGNSSDVGESLAGSYANSGSIRNPSHIYHTGLINGPSVPAANKTSIWRFAVASPHVSADVGEHSIGPTYPVAGQWGGTTDGISGFTHGGQKEPGSNSIDHIEKFTMASPAPSSDTGAELSVERFGASGVSDVSNGYGYGFGGESYPPTNTKDVIDKYAFVSTADAADVGNLSAGARTYGGSLASETRGFMAGGSPGTSNVIDSVPFSSDGDATDWGDLTEARGTMAGCQSTTHGYIEGGSLSTTIDKFSHSSTANATDVGEAPVGNKGGSMSEI